MIQSRQSFPLKRIPHRRNKTQSISYYQDQDEDYHQLPSKHDLFMRKFKNNQNSLRTKFKKYVQQKKAFFPNAYHNLSHFQRLQDGEQLKNIREVRQQKKKLISDLNQSMNESRYALAKRKSFEVTCSLLSNKVRRVEQLRQQRKSQVLKMERTMRAISQEIQEEKLHFKRKVDQSKYSLLKSRMQKSHQNMELAETVREQSLRHESRIQQEKSIIIQENIEKCRTVREEERKVEMNQSRVYEQKKSKADSLKVEKLFRELAEKEEVKIISARIKNDTTNRIAKMQHQTLDLERKIREYRKSLGEKRLDPPRVSLPKCNNRVRTQEHESTNSELLSLRKNGDYSSQGFQDDQ